MALPETESPQVMMLVDDRIGSRELLRPLRRAGVEAKLRRLEFGDFSFTGNGPTGPLKIGVERKKVNEILQAITDRRFTKRQIPGMLTTYAMSWVIVEGYCKPDPHSGSLLLSGNREAGFGYARGRVLYETFAHFLMSVQIQSLLSKTGSGLLIVQPTHGLHHTVAWLQSLYTWWNKRWQDHSTFKGVDTATVDRVDLDGEQSVKRAIAAQLPGVYWKRSRAADEHFSSILHMMVASEKDWRRVEGIGPITAKNIVRTIRKRDTGRQHD